VNLASRGLRDMDSGSESISDANELAQVRRQARKVYIEAIVTALVLGAVALAIPAMR
jgi:hypothetical protein